MVIDDIKKMISPDVFIDMDVNKSILRIKESGIDAKLKKVDITGVNVDLTVAFKLDFHLQLSPYLNRTEKNINKGCDAIILIENNNQKHLLICELKSRKPKPIDFIAQMKNSSLFLDYLGSILKTFYGSDLTLFKKKYILFYLTSLNKKSTRPKTMITPERIHGITVYKAYNYRQINIGKLLSL